MSKKDDIINTALRLFNSYSYNSIGVDRIINESGVAKMTFYKHFPSKEKLIDLKEDFTEEKLENIIEDLV